MAPSDEPPADWPDASLPHALSGEWAAEARPPEGRYTRGAVLGQGGMGTVYVAQDVLLRRQVALKQAQGDPTGPAARRLQHEARITAALDHPGIVSVYDLGADPDGRPWYTMRVVRGRSLRQALDAAPDLAARLRLVRPLLHACQAMAHAHHRGVVHRDLKPDNLMLGPFGEVQVMDWGLAVPVEGADPGWAAVVSGVYDAADTAVGTPAYMSPQQAQGGAPARADDVWALGACLHELLTGERAFRGPTPQSVMDQVRASPGLDPRAVAADAPPELAAIAARATAPAPKDRYADAAALAADLEAWLDGRRVSAHRYTAADELARTLDRSRRTLRAVGLVGLVALIVVGVFWQRTLAERDRAVAARAALESAQQQANRHLAHALVAQARAAARVGARGEAETLAAHALMLDESPEARGLLMDAGARPRLLSDGAPPGACIRRRLRADGAVLACRASDRVSVYGVGDDAPQWEVTASLADVAFSAEGHVFGRMTGVEQPRFLHRDSGGPLSIQRGPPPDTDFAAPSHRPGVVLFHNTVFAERVELATGRMEVVAGAAPIEAALVLPSGELLLVEAQHLVQRRADGAVVSRRPLSAAARGDVARVSAMEVDQEAGLVVLGFLDGWVEVHRLDRPERIDATRLAEGMVVDVQLSADGAWAAAVDERGGAWLWPVGEAPARQRLPGRAQQVAFADAETLVVLGARLRRWALPRGARSRMSAANGVSNLDWSQDRLAAALAAGAIQTWTSDGLPVQSRRWFGDLVTKDVALSPDGRSWVGAALAVPPWLARPDREDVAIDGMPSGCRRVVWLEPDLVVCAPFRHGPFLARVGGASSRDLSRPGLVAFDLEPAPDRRSAVMAADSGEVLLLEGGPQPSLTPLFTDSEVRAVALTSDRQRVVVVLPDRVEVRDRSGATLWQQATATRLRDVAVSPGDAVVAGGERDGRTRLWAAADGRPLAVLGGHDERVQSVVFSPDGARLATGSWDDTVRLWDLTVLDRDPAALLAEVEANWGLSLDAALASDAGL